MFTNICCRVFVVVVILVRNGFSQTEEGERCIDTHTNTYGVCRPARSCESAILDYKEKRIRATICSRERLLVCCRNGGNNSPVAPISLLDDKRQAFGYTANDRPSSNSTRRVSERKCEEYSRAVTKNAMSVSVTGTKCPFNGDELRILGGQDTELGEFPHMAAIGWFGTNESYNFKCGGSLISQRFVVTAGHCSLDPHERDPQPAIVRLGDRNLEPDFDDGARPIDIPIRRIIKHPEYKPPKRFNDIALLELATDVDFEVNIRPACLWQGGPFTQDEALATGWGVTNLGSRTISNELKKVSITLLQNSYCDQLLIKIQNRNWRRIQETQMCAGEHGEGKGTFQGDSGAPLQLVSRNNSCIHHIIGITSFGHKCAERGKPAIYTRVSSYLHWIESVVWPNE